MLTLSLTSANTLLLTPGGIIVVPTASTTSTRTFLVTLTPAVGQTGTSTLTLQAGDGSALGVGAGGIQRHCGSHGAGRADGRPSRPHRG